MKNRLNSFFILDVVEDRVSLRIKFDDNNLITWKGQSMDIDDETVQFILRKLEDRLQINLLIDEEYVELFESFYKYIQIFDSPYLSKKDISYNLLHMMYKTRIEFIDVLKERKQLIWDSGLSNAAFGILLLDQSQSKSYSKKLHSMEMLEKFSGICFVQKEHGDWSVGPFLGNNHINDFNIKNILSEQDNWEERKRISTDSMFDVDQYVQQLVYGMLLEFFNDYLYGTSVLHNKIVKVSKDGKRQISNPLPIV